mmetsp:Transcript_68965/g.202462  ORF Transcript_68965/g.202462 Transcript_68965/m.202462 type:complete len:263 (+) Transcript_68965:56-844(+)
MPLLRLQGFRAPGSPGYHQAPMAAIMLPSCCPASASLSSAFRWTASGSHSSAFRGAASASHSSALRVSARWSARKPGRRCLRTLRTSRSKAMKKSCSGDQASTRASSQSASAVWRSPPFTSQKTNFPAGTFAMTSESSGGVFRPEPMKSTLTCRITSSKLRSQTGVSSTSASQAPPGTCAHGSLPEVRRSVSSWRRKIFPSALICTSNSAPSAPSSKARSTDSRVFSEAQCDAPRWPTTLVLLRPAVDAIQSSTAGGRLLVK